MSGVALLGIVICWFFSGPTYTEYGSPLGELLRMFGPNHMARRRTRDHSGVGGHTYSECVVCAVASVSAECSDRVGQFRTQGCWMVAEAGNISAGSATYTLADPTGNSG